MLFLFSSNLLLLLLLFVRALDSESLVHFARPEASRCRSQLRSSWQSSGFGDGSSEAADIKRQFTLSRTESRDGKKLELELNCRGQRRASNWQLSRSRLAEGAFIAADSAAAASTKTKPQPLHSAIFSWSSGGSGRSNSRGAFGRPAFVAGARAAFVSFQWMRRLHREQKRGITSSSGCLVEAENDKNEMDALRFFGVKNSAKFSQ